MRFLWTYLIVVIVFAFGFLSASAFMVGMTPPHRARRGVKPKREPYTSSSYEE